MAPVPQGPVQTGTVSVRHLCLAELSPPAHFVMHTNEKREIGAAPEGMFCNEHSLQR